MYHFVFEVTANNCTACGENQYTDPKRQKCIRCSLLRPVTKDRTQCSNDYTIVVVSGLIYIAIAIFYIYKIIEDPIYKIDASIKEVNEKCSKYIEIILDSFQILRLLDLGSQSLT